MYDQVVKCQRAGLCLSEHFLITEVLIADNGLLSILSSDTPFERECT